MAKTQVKIFSSEKNPDLITLAGLQLVEEFATPLLPHFLSLWGLRKPLDDTQHSIPKSSFIRFLIVLGSML
jgi:hypothetical protein